MAKSHDRAVLAAFAAAKIELSNALSRARLQAGKPSYREMSRQHALQAADCMLRYHFR
jgi:hypothetical protein